MDAPDEEGGPGVAEDDPFYPPGFKRDPRFRYGTRPMEKPKEFMGGLP